MWTFVVPVVYEFFVGWVDRGFVGVGISRQGPSLGASVRASLEDEIVPLWAHKFRSALAFPLKIFSFDSSGTSKLSMDAMSSF